jgi:Ca-activated chloride channel family protein
MRTLVVMIVFATLGLSQEPLPLHVDVNLVNVDFAVRDTQGGLASHLTRDDFEILEDGVPQKIEFFSRTADVPLTLGLIADFSGSQEHFLKRHHKDLQLFLSEVLGPNDRAFLICFGNHLRLASDLTPSTSDLMDGLKAFEHDDRHFPELGPAGEDRELGTAFYDAIYYPVTEKLERTVSGQKALIVFSDGEDNSSAHDMMDAIEAAQTANVRVYGMRYTEGNHGRLTARNKYGIRVMDRIAVETGAAAFDAEQGDVKKWFDEIGEDLRSSYSLAYYPTTPQSQDGSFRKITLRAKKPGLAVRCKTGYFARPIHASAR